MFPDATRPVIEPIELQALCRLAALGRPVGAGVLRLILAAPSGGAPHPEPVEGRGAAGVGESCEHGLVVRQANHEAFDVLARVLAAKRPRWMLFQAGKAAAVRPSGGRHDANSLPGMEFIPPPPFSHLYIEMLLTRIYILPQPRI